MFSGRQSAANSRIVDTNTPLILRVNTAIATSGGTGNTGMRLWVGSTQSRGSTATIDWGDGSATDTVIVGANSPAPVSITHTYPSSGFYNISVRGSFAISGYRIGTGNPQDSAKVVDVLQWGNSPIISMLDMFNTSSIVSFTATDTPNLSLCNSMRGTFGYLRNFNEAKIGSWNTSAIQNFESTFFNCTNFNQPLALWDTSSATDMDGMFKYCGKFNRNISGWNVSSVNSMIQMFQGASAFNQNLSPWATDLPLQPGNFSLDANATWTSNKTTLFPFLADGVTRINT
jgi:surface protein